MLIRNWGKSLAIGAALFAGALASAPAQATPISFTYDCKHTAAATCGAAGPFGTITLNDSTIDANRVDVTLTLNQAAIQGVDAGIKGLNNFFLNYNGPTAANTVLRMVLQTDAANTTSPTIGDISPNPTGSFTPDNQGAFDKPFDLLLDPNGSAEGVWSYAASIVMFSTNAGHAETNLDMTMFMLRDQNVQLWAGFDTLPTNSSFRFGALTQVTPQTTTVPEPLTLSLFGAGLAGVIGLRRRKRAALGA